MFKNFNNILLLSIPFLFIILLIASVGAIAKNWDLQKQMNAKQAEKSLLELDVNKIKLENQYYASDEYQELEAGEGCWENSWGRVQCVEAVGPGASRGGPR